MVLAAVLVSGVPASATDWIIEAQLIGVEDNVDPPMDRLEHVVGGLAREYRGDHRRQRRILSEPVHAEPRPRAGH